MQRAHRPSNSAARRILMEALEPRQLLSGVAGPELQLTADLRSIAPGDVHAMPIEAARQAAPADQTSLDAASARKAARIAREIASFETHLTNEVKHNRAKLTNAKFLRHLDAEQTRFAAKIARQGGTYTPVPIDSIAVGTAKPVAPTLTGVANSASQITLSWTSTTGATAYKLEGSINSGRTWTVLYRGLLTTYAQGGLTADAARSYRVSVSTRIGTSNPSALLSTATLLAPPTNIKVTALSTTRIDVSWTPVTHATGYKIERSPNQSTWTALAPSPALTGTSSTYSDTTATPGNTFYYRVSTIGATGASVPATVVHALTLPDRPTLTATVASATSVNVTWTSVSSAATYIVERSQDGGSTWSTVVTQATTTYTNTGLAADTAYKYRVSATDATGTGAASSVASVTTVLVSPTGVSATDASATQVNLAWTAVTDATTYKIERSVDQAAWTTLAPNPALTGSNSTYTDATAAAGTTYYYRISAVDAAGASAPAAVVHALTLPNSPTLTATVTSATAIALSWTASTSATSYLLERSADGGNTWATVVSQATLTYANTGLTADTGYTYRVSAANATGPSAVSASVSKTTYLAAPIGLTATASLTSPTLITLGWTATVDATGYKIERSLDQTTWTALVPSPALTGGSIAYGDSAVSAGTTYYYRISAINNVGSSAASTAVHALTLPAAPTLTATVTSSTALSLSWTAVPSATAYLLERSADGGNTWTTAVSQATLTYANTGLTADTAYRYRVSASNATGSSALSAIQTITTTLNAPSGTTATAVSGTQINIAWTPLNDATSYKIERSSDQTTWTALVPSPALTGSSLAYSDSSVSAGTTYYYRVSAIDAAGTSAASTVAHALTFPATPVVTATVGSATSINLNWVAIKSATTYTVESSTDGGFTWSTLSSPAAVTYTNTGLTADTTYKYRVSAVNATGSSSPSTVSTITTLLTAPSGLAAAAASVTQVNLSWTAEIDATSYKIERSTDQTNWTALAPNPALTGSSVSYTDSTVVASTTYYYRLSGIDAAGTSAPAAAVHASTPPSSPTLTSTVASASVINVAWAAVPTATSYTLETSTDGGTTWSTLASPTGVTYSNTGLSADTAYKYRLSANSAGGTSAPSAVITATTMLGAPASLTGTVVSGTEIDLAWPVVTHATTYKIERSPNGTTWTALTPSPALTGSSAAYNDTGLTTGTTYYYRISATNSVGTSVPTAAVHYLTLPTATTLTGTVTSASQISLTWTAVASAISYTVQVSTDNGGTWNTLASTTATTFSSTGLTADTAYKYRIAVINAGGASLPSNILSLTTLLAAPAGFTATPSTSALEVDLAWTAVTHATTYKLERSVDNTNWTVLTPSPALTGSSVAYADTGLSAGTNYFYRISAINLVGPSATAPVMQGLTIPAVPTLTPTVVSSTQINFSWTAVTGAATYLLETSTDGSTWTTAVSQSGTTFSATGLAADTVEHYRISASNATGSSATSTPITPATLPVAPAGFAAAASTSALQVALTWTAVTGATTYKIERSVNQTAWTALVPSPALVGTDATYTDATAAAGTTYYYRISTIDANGTSTPAAVVNALTLPATSVLTGTVASATAINFSWAAVKGAATYLLETSTDSSTWTTVVSQAGTTYSQTGLSADTAYQYRLSAVNATGASATTTAQTLTTILAAPTGFAATASTSSGTEIDLAWTAVTHASTYKLERSLDNTIWTTLAPSPALVGTDAAYADTHVLAGTTYYYRLSAVNSVGTSAAAAVVHALSIPATPTLTATVASATQINFSWNAMKGAATYLLETSTDGSTWTTVVSQAGTTYSQSGLTADTAYEYRLSAVNATGASATTAAQTLTTILGAPTGLAATASTSTGTEIDLVWTAVTHASTYKLERSLDNAIWTTLAPSPALVGTDAAYADTSVLAGTTYYYRLSAVNSVGTSAPAAAVHALTIPATPALSSTVVSATQINFAWTTVKGAATYLLETSTDGSTWTTVVSQAGTTYSQTGLTADTAYHYRLSAVNATGASATTAGVILTTILAAPAGFAATPSTSTLEVDLAWTAVTHATTYKLERSVDQNVWTTLAPSPALVGTDATYADTSVVAGTTYYYRLSVVNSVGTSAAAAVVHGLTLPATPVLTGTVASATAINFSWAAVKGAATYLLETSTDGSTWTTVVSQAGTTYSQTGLSADTAYQYRLSAVNATGASATTTAQTLTTILAAPTGFAATASTSSGTEIDLAWTAVTHASTYKLERSLDNTIWTTLAPSPALVGTDAAYADTHVLAGTTYYYRLSAVNSVGTSAAAAVVHALSIPATPTLTATVASATQINLSWTPVLSATGYVVETSADGGSHWVASPSQTATTLVSSSLTADTSYEYRVTASNGTGPGVTSSIVTLSTLLGAPAGFSAMASMSVDTEVDLAWTAVTHATGYKIERSTDNVFWTTLAPSPALAGTAATYADMTASPGTTYYYRISAIGTAGTSAASTVGTALTLPDSTTLTATAVSDTEIDLSWTAVQSASSYVLDRSPDGVHWSTINNTLTTQFADTGLTADTSYVYRVTVENGTGGGTPTANQTLSTLLGAPTNFVGVSSAATQVDLTWTAVTHASNYIIERSDDVNDWTTLTPSPALNGASAAYSDTTVAANTTYYYRISAVGTAGTSPVSATVTVLTLLVAPTGLTATAASASQINLSWTPDTDAGLLNFKLQGSADGSTGWTTIETVSAASTTASDIRLTASTIYYYRLVAVNASGDSAPSTSAHATTLAS